MSMSRPLAKMGEDHTALRLATNRPRERDHSGDQGADNVGSDEYSSRVVADRVRW